MNINEMAEKAHTNSVKHGFWDTGNKDPEELIPEKLCLIHSEVSEALEEYRKPDEEGMYLRVLDGKPEGFGSELADIMIRVGDLAYAMAVDLEDEVERKMAYNESRPYKHNKAC